jgi:hypothetical protein
MFLENGHQRVRVSLTFYKKKGTVIETEKLPSLDFFGESMKNAVSDLDKGTYDDVRIEFHLTRSSLDGPPSAT